MVDTEKDLNFTIDNKLSLDEFIAGATTDVLKSDKKALYQTLSGEFSVDDVKWDDQEVIVFRRELLDRVLEGPC